MRKNGVRIPIIVVRNKIDLPSKGTWNVEGEVQVSCRENKGIEKILEKMTTLV